jgi:hypothetical protein
MFDLTGHMIIWGGLFARGEGSTGLIKVAFCYARLITVRVPIWPPNAKLPRSAPAVLNGRCRTRLDMNRSSLGVVLRGLPARGRSVTFPV